MMSDDDDLTTPEPAADEPLGDGGRKALEAERKARRDAEQRLTAAAKRLETMQRRAVERLAETELADPADLWRAGDVELGSLLDDSGEIDAERVRETVGKVVETHPHWSARRRPPAGSADGGRGSPPIGGDGVQNIADRIMRR
jgi:hypothetical protein